MPSPCAALTSSPFFNSARTASASRFIAASATGAGPAPCSNAETANTAATLTARKRIRVTIACSLSGERRLSPSLNQPGLTPRLSERLCLFRRSRRRRNRLQIEATRRVAELLHVFETDVLQHRQEHVGHRRAVGGLEMEVAAQRAAGLAGEEQRAALVIVHVRVAHRRAVDHQRVVEQVVL